LLISTAVNHMETIFLL